MARQTKKSGCAAFQALLSATTVYDTLSCLSDSSTKLRAEYMMNGSIAEGFVEKSRVNEILRCNDANRAILYFALGLSDAQTKAFFDNEWCVELNMLSAKVDARHFGIVDEFDAGTYVQYRALLLLDCIRSQFSQGEGRLAELALLRSGTNFDCFRNNNVAVGDALKNSLFNCQAEDVLRRAGAFKGSVSDKQNCSKFHRILVSAYGQMHDIAGAMEGLRDKNNTQKNSWFVRQEKYTDDTHDDIVISFMVRHVNGSTPEVIIAIEHTIVEVDKAVADEFARDFNCDSYVESDGQEEADEADTVETTKSLAVTLRVMRKDTTEDVTFELSSATWEAVVEGFALCFPQYSVTKDIATLSEGAHQTLVDGDSEAVQIYIEECAAHNIAAVFVHELRPGEATAVVAQREPAHILRRPQHHVAIAMYDRVRARLKEDGQSIEHYKRLQYVIFVPKFNSLKQQTKERIEACAELVRDNEDASCLVELYPLTGASVGRVEALQNEILDEGNNDVLYVLIVDECHHAPTQTGIRILHHPEIQSRLNFIALMVSATPYSCLSERSRVPRDNIIEWSKHIDAADRPNYIGFEHYFRSVTYRLPSWELLLTIDGAPITVNLPQYREFADFESLADVVTAQLLGCVELCSSLRCAFVSSKYTFALKRQARLKTQTLCIVCNNFLRGLGFVSDIIFPAEVSFTAAAPKEPSIDNGTSVASQHMREDRHFSELYKAIVAECPVLERYNTRGKAPGMMLCCILSFLTVVLIQFSLFKALGNGAPVMPKVAIRPEVHCPPLKHALMADKNGFTIIIDYIFSLAYFGSCRLLHQPDSTTFALGPLPIEVTDQMCNEFLRMLDESCYFDYSSDDARYPSVSCDISRAVKAALDALCNSAKDERPDLVDVLQLVKYILESKVKEERNHTNTSENQTWFTETDRIVLMLLVERKPAPMVLMRVFDKDENRSMQTILRHSMGVCGLVRRRAGRCNVPAFSVITDVSETSLLREIEPYYRDEYNVGDEGNPMHVRDITAQRHQTQTEFDTKVPNLDLKYEDLLNVPCLIILCEKGRMGDTFPHTLRALDLRLRTGGTATCFLQEIGRMCRYPKTQYSALVAVETLEGYFLDAQPKFGVTVSIPSSNAFLGVAKDAGDVTCILAGLGESDTMSHVQLAHLVHPLPYALIDPRVMDSIRRAINKREADVSSAIAGAPLTRCDTERIRADHKIISNLRMHRGVDEYLTCQIMKEPHAYRLMRSKSHYDFSNTATEKHDRRFLLSAECQVGKTGAYLHLLTLLRHAIEKGDNLNQVVPVAPTIPVGSRWCEWLIPCEKDLRGQPSLQYDFPKTGKYHDSIAKQRIAQLNLLLSHPEDDLYPLHRRFADCIQEYEQVTTQKGLSLLDDLSRVTVGKGVDYRQYVNWDGRFCRDGRWHPMLEEDSFLGALFDESFDNRVPLAQDTMFGVGANTQSVDPRDADIDSDFPIIARFGSTFTPVSSETDVFNSVAKALTRTPRIVPINDSVMVTLSNFFGDATSLPRHELGPDSSATLITLSVPKNAFCQSLGNGNNFTFNSGAELNAKLHQPQRIKSWIFTPSFCGTAVGPEEKLLLRDDAFSVDNKPLARWGDFGEVLVVRASQLEMYQQFYGGTHIIAALPDTMQFVDADGVVRPVMDASKHGCGYARRFSQLLAQYMGWQSIWMIDDYVLKCWKLVCTELVCNPNNVTLEPASFAEVMLHIESMFFCRPEVSTYPNLDQQIEKMVGSAELTKVTGAMADKYGVIGMCRGKQWRSHIAHPIKRSYSVYSFFLLNVRATAGRNLFFPARPIWEDIEFNHSLDENGLLLCKLQVFAHEKLSHAPAEPSPLEPEEVSDLEKFMLWLNSHDYFPSSQRMESLMTQPQENSFLASIDDYIQSSCNPADPQSVCYLSLVHNPRALQRGAFNGMRHSTNTLQGCIDNILNESGLLEGAVESVLSGEVGSATWLIIFPHTGAVPALSEPLRDDCDPQRGLRVSYALVPAPETAVDMGDAFVVICATVQRCSEGEEVVNAEMGNETVEEDAEQTGGDAEEEGEEGAQMNSWVDPIVQSTQAMEIDTVENHLEIDCPRSSDSADAFEAPRSSAKRKRNSSAGPSPRKRNTSLNPQEQQMLLQGPALVLKCDNLFAEQGLTEKQGQRRTKIRDEVFRELVATLNEIGPKCNLDSKWVYDWCKRRAAAQSEDFDDARAALPERTALEEFNAPELTGGSLRGANTSSSAGRSRSNFPGGDLSSPFARVTFVDTDVEANTPVPPFSPHVGSSADEPFVIVDISSDEDSGDDTEDDDEEEEEEPM